MTPERLKELAEAAGLEVEDRCNDGSYLPRPIVFVDDLGWLPLCPALLPLIAERLADKAEFCPSIYWQTSGRWVVVLSGVEPNEVSGDFWGDAMSEAIAEAAYAVLQKVEDRAFVDKARRVLT